MSWPEVTLNQICTTQYGYTASAQSEEIGPKFLRITDIVNSTIDWPSVPYCYIDESLISKYKLEQGDIVIARTGNTTGYAKLIRENIEAVFASYLVRLKIDPSVAYPGFIGRLIESDIYKSFVEGIKVELRRVTQMLKPLHFSNLNFHPSISKNGLLKFYPITTTSSKTIGVVLSSWSRQHSCFTRNGSSTFASPAMNMSKLLMVCPRSGRRKPLEKLLR